MMRTAIGSVTLIFCGLLSLSAIAVDGVIEISETCATQLGCFSGDAVGYPVTIDGSAGNSYRLTSNLVIPDSNTHGIFVSAPSIQIDLNGFEIVGIGCVAATTDCTPTSGTGVGIQVQGSNIFGVSVANGGVTGMGRFGVSLFSPQSRATDLRLRWNRNDGLRTGIGSIVSGVITSNNGADGMQLGGSSRVSGSVAFGNGAAGIQASTGSSVVGNTAYDNATRGISVGGGSVVRDNAAYSNAGNGIHISSSNGAVVANNSSTNNGGDGIFAFGSSIVQNNNVSGNTGTGLNLTATDGFAGNVVSINSNPQVTGGVNLGNNLCNPIACP